MGNRHRSIGWSIATLCLAAWLLPASAGDVGMKALRRLVGDAACTSGDQCRTIAVGVSACGGPAAYLAWSSLRTDPTALREAAARYTASYGSRPVYGGNPSTCRVLPDPGAFCALPGPPAASTPSTGHCRLRENRSTEAPSTQ